MLTKLCLEHVAGRVPVIVTTTHFSSRICVERSQQAEAMGAAMVMVMPPYHGATFRVGEAQVRDFFRVLSDSISIPIMIQDAPVAGTPLSPRCLRASRRSLRISAISRSRRRVRQPSCVNSSASVARPSRARGMARKRSRSWPISMRAAPVR